MNKLNCLKNKDEENELEILEFLEKKFENIDSNLEKKIYGVFKNKHIRELNDINFAIENIKNNYLIEKRNLEKLLQIKNNLLSYIKSNEDYYKNEIKKEINPDYLCNICYENRCNLVLNPCGHIFCDKCYSSKEKFCFICRKAPTNCIKIFHN